MTTYRNYILTILLFFCSLTLFAENKLATINDPDGFANVRSGQGKEFAVIATVDKDEFFYCDLTIKDEWIKIVAMKWKNNKQVEGYIHRSRIQLVEKLDNLKKKELITQILNRQKILADNFQNAWKTKDSLAYRTTVRELELYSEIKYSPILDILPKYFCSTNDIDILQLFFSTMWADKGSANETPSFSIGYCFICKPDIIVEQLSKIKNTEQKNLIFDHTEWGLLNHFEVDENGNSENKEFSKLKARLDNERKKASP